MMKSVKWIMMLVGVFPLCAIAQSNNQKITGQDDAANPITVAVPFVSFAPDSRGSAMGDAGVASSPDVFSSYWNSGKLAFIEKDLGVSFSYSPWLGKIINDMSLNYLSFYKKIDRVQTFGASFRYFDLGEIQLTDENQQELGIENPYELALDATYSRKLTENMGVGVTTRFIWSNIAGNISGAPDAKAGTSVAVDIGWYYTQPIIFGGMDAELAFGANLSNFGQKINYSNDSNEDFIPTMLTLGSAFTSNLDLYNSITLMVDFRKLLVPTPPRYVLDDNGNPVTDPNDPSKNLIESGKDPNRTLLSGTFGSFADAPRGFQEEMEEIMISVGAEYLYQDIFAVRAGYFFENKNKGDRKYFTAGVGFKYQIFGVDFSYLIPQEKDHPLAETLRLSFQFNMDQKDS